MGENLTSIYKTQIVIPSSDLNKDIAFFSGIGFRLDKIYPSDDPDVAIMTGHHAILKIDKGVNCEPPFLEFLTDDKNILNAQSKVLQSPSGTKIKFVKETYELELPKTKHKFEVRRLQENDSWVIGRAGMLYRDLIPDRLGGSIIASHINIKKGGPVPDVVHYHTIGFQLIFCYSGWVKLVYEDQGPPFILEAGDCVTQPPEIRHCVLESSDNLEVIEIGIPSDHMTTIDHKMKLPTASFNPDRQFQGQVFCHHKANEAEWKSWDSPAFQYRDSGVEAATKGMASVKIIRLLDVEADECKLNHIADILFHFVTKGQISLNVAGEKKHVLKKGDAFVIPPKIEYKFMESSGDFEMLEVSVKGAISSK